MENVEEDKVTADSYGRTDITHVADECWMLRIPQKLAELWDAAPEGTDLGELIFTKGGVNDQKQKIKPELGVKVRDALPEEVAASKKSVSGRSGLTASATPSIPLDYSLQAMTKKVPVLHPFVRNPNNGSCEMLGTVTRTANMQVERGDRYRSLLKDRLVASNVTNNRYVKTLDSSESVMSKKRNSATDTNNKGFGAAVHKYGQRLLEAQQDAALRQRNMASDSDRSTKKSRQFSPDQPIRSVLFALFGERQYWTVKDLKAAAVSGGSTECGTKRGESEIREILNDIGEYHRSGDNKNMWELREEFQQKQRPTMP